MKRQGRTHSRYYFIMYPDKQITKRTNVKPKIIALQEVKPKNFKFARTMAEYNLKGDEFIHRNLEKQDNGPGLLVYISSDIHYNPVTFEQEFTIPKCESKSE